MHFENISRNNREIEKCLILNQIFEKNPLFETYHGYHTLKTDVFMGK